MATTAKSRSSSREAIDRPFDPVILRRARDVAKLYGIVLWQEEGEYYSSTIELPNCMGIGKTPDACIQETRALMVTAIARDLERGIEPPSPAKSNRRTEQVNVRLSPIEKKRLEVAAEAGGYHGVSDYIRDLALAK